MRWYTHFIYARAWVNCESGLCAFLFARNNMQTPPCTIMEVSCMYKKYRILCWYLDSMANELQMLATQMRRLLSDFDADPTLDAEGLRLLIEHLDIRLDGKD